MPSILAISSGIARWFAPLALATTTQAPPAPEPAVPPPIPESLSIVYGPATDAKISALGPESLAIGWCVEEGPAEGLYVTRRRDGRWDDLPVALLPDVAGARPRDLAISHGAAGDIHLAWTATHGERRRAVYCAIGADGEPTRAPLVVNPSDAADADYPVLAELAGAGRFVIWQSARGASYSIEVALLPSPQADGFLRQAALSGASQSAIAPQLVSPRFATVAWREIGDESSALQAAHFNPFKTPNWEPFSLGEESGLAPRQQPTLLISPEGALYACWTEAGPEGTTTIRLSRGLQAGAPSMAISESAGDQRQPQIQSAGEGRLTLSWQALAPGDQSARLAWIDWSDPGKPELARTERLSAPDRPFAAEPSHGTAGAWTGAAWIDDHRDGGSGTVGFAEAWRDAR